MIRLKKWSEKPSGQVLAATLFFCFVFFALFLGLYKSGMVYGAKERAVRATDLTALSAGAVYANGLQLVRLTNAILLVFASLDLVIIASSRAITEGVAQVDPHFRRSVQNIQDILFGLTYPTGAYPLLIFSEGLSLATDNGLENNWPAPARLSWQVPIPPSPLFLFNFETSGLPGSILPNMALKFRTADVFLADINQPRKPKTRYHLKQKGTGKIHTFTEDEVEIAPHSKNPGQMRVKAGDFKGKYVGLAKDVETEAEKDAAGLLRKENPANLKSLSGLSNLLSGINLDVTDRDDPPNHTFLVYSHYPAPVQSRGTGSTDLQTLGEICLEGDGLAAWDLEAPSYRAQLIPVGPDLMAGLADIRKRAGEWASANGLPSFSDLFNRVPQP